jgi:hypothetical protein
MQLIGSENGSLAVKLKQFFVRESTINCEEDPTSQSQGNSLPDPKSTFFDYGQAS